MTAMKRKEIRALKRAVSGQGNADAMHMLLQRSVRFGHRRLALIRCIQAERMGVRIAPEVLAYCQRIADRMTPERLGEILRKAAELPASAP
jgi:hypothetical protein